MNRFSLIIFILLVLFESFIDPDINLCSRLDGKLLLFTHHILSIYILTGTILLGNPLVHFLISITTVLLWIKYSRCVTTIYNNKLCNFDSNYQFKNFFYHIRNLMKANHFAAEAFIFKIFLLLIFDLYLILKENFNII